MVQLQIFNLVNWLTNSSGRSPCILSQAADTCKRPTATHIFPTKSSSVYVQTDDILWLESIHAEQEPEAFNEEIKCWKNT
jgi:hypothetical protein